MACRRDLLLVLASAALLLACGPTRALAAPQWLGAEPQPGAFPAGAAPDVATDGDGNAVAVWVDDEAVQAAYRPRGGPWELPADIEPRADPEVSDAHVTVLPNGEFVAAWIADRNDDGDVILRAATRSSAGAWTAETIREGCCEGIEAFDASGDGSVTVVGGEDGGPFSNTRPPGSPTWGPRLDVPAAPGSQYAFGLDGSVLVADQAICGVLAVFPCVASAYLPPGGTAWGDPETVAGATSGSQVTGVGITAAPGGAFTVVWGEAAPSAGGPVAPGRVRSADRDAGVGGAWQTALTVAGLPGDVPGCFGAGDCFDVAAGSVGAEVALWQQRGSGGGQISAAVRGPGGTWGPVEDAGDPRGGAARPLAAITSTGVPVAAWSSEGDNLAVANGSHRDAAGVWRPVALGSSQDDTVFLADLAADGDGNALTAYRHRGGVFTAGFDGGAPRFGSVGYSGFEIAGQPLSFFTDVSDAWSGVASISWLFGDGGGASGASVSHAYASAGTFSATATAQDGVGNVSRGSVTVEVGPAPPIPFPCSILDADNDGIGDQCDDNNGAARPVAFKTLNARVVSGEVFVKLPAGAARASQGTTPPKGFVRLEGAETIPVGATLDTAKGRVRLRTAADTRRRVQTAEFFRGRFVVRQVRQPRRRGKPRSTRLITDTILTGSSFRRACNTTTASISQKRRRSKRRVRRLFGDGKGTFRTRGRNAAATVRGTRWSVQDRCDGTLVTVQRGRVSVRDLVRRKTVTVRTGRTYLARRR